VLEWGLCLNIQLLIVLIGLLSLLQLESKSILFVPKRACLKCLIGEINKTIFLMFFPNFSMNFPLLQMQEFHS